MIFCANPTTQFHSHQDEIEAINSYIAKTAAHDY
jgi:hypothetical protein